MYKNFSELIKAYRNKQYISREVLARKIGKSAQGIKDIEDGKTALPQPDTIKKLGEALNIEEEILWKVADNARLEKQKKLSHSSESPFPLTPMFKNVKLPRKGLQNSKENYISEVVMPIVTKEEGRVMIYSLTGEHVGYLTIALTTAKKLDFFLKFSGDLMKSFCIESGMLLGIRACNNYALEDLIAIKNNNQFVVKEFKEFVEGSGEIAGKVVLKTTDPREI